MIRFTHKGNFAKTTRYFERLKQTARITRAVFHYQVFDC